MLNETSCIMLQNGCPQAKEKTKHFKIELTSPDVDMSTWSTSLILSGDNEKEVLERVDLHINSGLIVKNVIEIVDTI